MKKCTLTLIGSANELVLSQSFCERHRSSPNNFTRHRRMGFVDVMGLCLNFLRKSLRIEIGRYMELTFEMDAFDRRKGWRVFAIDGMEIPTPGQACFARLLPALLPTPPLARLK